LGDKLKHVKEGKKNKRGGREGCRQKVEVASTVKAISYRGSGGPQSRENKEKKDN